MRAMLFLGKHNQYGWIFPVMGLGFFLTAGLLLAAQPDVPAKDTFREYVLEWDRLSRVDFPLLNDRPRKTAKLTLDDCIRRTLAHNLEIRIRSYDPSIRMADVVQAEAAFDAVLFSAANFSTTDQANPDSGFFTRTVQTNKGSRNKKIPGDPFDQLHDYNYALGLRKRLPTGATVELAQRARRLRREEEGLFRNPFFQTNLDLELRQPLLRDFGIDVNRAAIYASRNNFAISRLQFNLQVIQAVVAVEGNYWQLVFFRQRIRILEELLRQSTATLERLIQRTTLNSVLQQQDRLLESMNDPNLPLRELWEIIPLDPPVMQKYHLERNDAIQTALQTRPELISQELSIDTAALAVGVAQNQLLPRLDLVARQEVTAPGGSMGTAWQNQHDYDTVNYLAGVSLEVPLGNRAPRAELLKAKLQERQEKLNLDNFKEQVLLDVSVSLQELNSAFEEIEVRLAAANAEADELRASLVLEDSAAKIDVGFLDRKLFAQERLAQYQSALAQTIFRYNAALADVQRAQGTLLHYHNINLAELAENNK